MKSKIKLLHASETASADKQSDGRMGSVSLFWLGQMGFIMETGKTKLCIDYFASPDGELSGAISALYRKICNIPDAQRIEHMQALKSLTPEKLREYASAYAELAENGHLFTVGGATAIREHEDFYDLILDPLKDFS